MRRYESSRPYLGCLLIPALVRFCLRKRFSVGFCSVHDCPESCADDVQRRRLCYMLRISKETLHGSHRHLHLRWIQPGMHPCKPLRSRCPWAGDFITFRCQQEKKPLNTRRCEATRPTIAIRGRQFDCRKTKAHRSAKIWSAQSSFCPRASSFSSRQSCMF